ncbi:MAG: hypothetical protein MJ252_21190 [archaeon]|nr:hypothetical protein [archaeon]
MEIVFGTGTMNIDLQNPEKINILKKKNHSKVIKKLEFGMPNGQDINLDTYLSQRKNLPPLYENKFDAKDFDPNNTTVKSFNMDDITSTVENKFLMSPIQKNIFYRCNLERIHLDKKRCTFKVYTSDENNKSHKFIMYALKGNDGNFYIYNSVTFNELAALEKCKGNIKNDDYIGKITSNLFSTEFHCFGPIKENINILDLKNVKFLFFIFRMIVSFQGMSQRKQK